MAALRRILWVVVGAAGVLVGAPSAASADEGRAALVEARRLAHHAKDGAVTVHSERSREEAAELLEILAVYRRWVDATYRAAAGRLPAPPVTVVLYRDQERYLAGTRGFAHGLESNGGFYDGAAGAIFSFRDGNAVGLVLHEYAHALLGARLDDAAFSRYRRSGWPVWLDEGLAEAFAAVEIRRSDQPSEGAFRLKADPAPKLGALIDDDGRVHLPISLSRLLSADMSAYRGRTLDAYYAMAHALVHVLLRRPSLMRSLLTELERSDRPRAVTRRMVAELGGLQVLEGLLSEAVRDEVARAWDGPVVFAGADDTSWNWIRVGEGRARVGAGLDLGPGPVAAPGPMLVRQLAPLQAASLRCTCDVRRGTLELLLASTAEGIDRPDVRVRIDRRSITVHPPGSGGRQGPAMTVRLPRVDRAAVPLQVRIEPGGGSVRVAGREVAGFGAAPGPLRALAVARVDGTVRVSPLHVARLVRTYPAGPAPTAPAAGADHREGAYR